MYSPYYEQLKQTLQNKQQVWLITGVAGFIGSNLLKELLGLNQIVIGFDNFATGYKGNIESALADVTHKQQSYFQFHEGDIRSLESCRAVLKQGVNYILHQAALGSVSRSIETPEATHAINATGFLNLLIAAKEVGINRFVYASSSSVYGDSTTLPKVESHIGNPLSPYAASKYTNELYAKAFSTCYGLETIGLRYFNVFGPRQDPNGPYAAVIPRWITALVRHQPVFINGDGETTRDFCYVANAVQANLLAATIQNPEAVNTVYNIAVGERCTLNQLYTMMLAALNLKEVRPIYQDFRAGDIRHSLADVSKAKNLLRYEPCWKLTEGLKPTLEWFAKS